MSKPKSVPVPEAEANRDSRHHQADSGTGMQEPLSGSKKTKQHNHVSHNNPQG